jgi:hypothetical protein
MVYPIANPAVFIEVYVFRGAFKRVVHHSWTISIWQDIILDNELNEKTNITSIYFDMLKITGLIIKYGEHDGFFKYIPIVTDFDFS